MIKVLKITRVSIIAFFVALVLSFIFTGIAHAQEEKSPVDSSSNPEAAAKKHGVTFPVLELGGCKDSSACRSYCNDEANQQQCISFAKKKGFYEERHKDEAIIKQAQSELGCDSESSCRSICEKQDYIEKCQNFAQKHNLGGGPRGNPKDRKILEKAKEILGCDSEASCRSICENPANQEKCSNFASQTGLGGGTRRVGPGGCNSEESCKAFCENNKEECRKFGGPPDGADSARRGPGGCNSEESCQAYCQSHPEECAKLGPGDGSFGGERKGPGGCDSEESCKKYCEANPTECGSRGKMEEFSSRGEGRSPSEGFRHPDEGRFRDSRPQQEYRGDRENRGPDRNEGPREEFRVPSDEMPRQEPSGQQESPPQKEESVSPTREVQGVSTNQGLLQRFLNWLSKKV